MYILLIFKVSTEIKKTTEEKSIKVLKASKVLLDKTIANQTSEWIKDKVTAVNCITFLFFSRLIRHQGIFELSLRVIERWFTTLADSKNFLELDFASVAAVLNSSELLIDSELEVFDVMNAWLSYKRIERSKHAINLLQKVRLSLLTVPALNNILDKNLLITDNDECSKVVKKVIKFKNSFPYNFTNILPRSRHCSQKNFNIIFAGGEYLNFGNFVRNAFSIEGTDFSNVNSLPIMNYGRAEFKTFFIKGEIYVFGGFDLNLKQVKPIEKYSPATKTWDVVGQMYDNRFYFCACSFIDSIYLIGGFLEDAISSCRVFNTISKTWKEISNMKEMRKSASCAAFEGRIVVSGGHNSMDGAFHTVEAYDHIDNSWTNMPNMIERRDYHQSVAIKNKLFVVGGFISQTIEVYDSSSKKFAFLPHPFISFSSISDIADVTSVGNNVVMFSNRKGSVFLYDVENDVWSEKPCEPTKHAFNFSCASLPQ